MKMNSRNLLQSASVTAALVLLAATAHAQTILYWGGGAVDIANGTALPTTTTGTDLTGTWNTTTKNWATSPSGTTYQAWTSSVNDVSLGLVAAGAGNAASQTLTLSNGSNFTFSGRMYGGIFGGGYSQIFEFKPASGGNATVTLGGTSAVFDFTETVNNGTRGIQFDTGVGLAGSAQLILRGGSNMYIKSDSSAYTGAVRVENGVLKIDNYSGPSANMRGATSFDIHNVNLGLGDMTYSTMNGNPTELVLTYNSGLNAIGSTANVALSGGAMQFIGIRSASTPTVQNAGSLTLNTFGFLDLSAVNGTAGSGLDAQLNFQSGLTRSSGNATSARDMLLVGVNATGTLAGNTAAVTFTGGSTTYGNNLLAWASTTRAEFLKINTSNVLEVVASTQAATDLSTWATTYTSASDIRVGNNTAFSPTNSITNTTVNSLGLYTSGTAPTLTIASGNTLTIASGGLAYASAGTTTITGGSITTSSNNPLYFSVSGGGILLNSTITGTIDVVKSGAATLTFNALSANTYTGTTYVNGGTLNLNGNYIEVPGALVVNNGGTVIYKNSVQLASNSAITINEGGFLNIGNGQTLTTSGGITINNGQLYVGNGGLAANGGLAFNGGFLTMGVASGAHTVALGGNVSYASSATTAAVFEQDNGIYAGSAINSNLALGTAARTFNIADSSTMSEATPEMTIGLSITSGTGGALVKTGDGVLRLTGGAGYTGSTYSGQNTYTGGTTINAGTLNVGFASNIGVTANATATGAPTGASVFFAAPVNLIVGQKLTGSDNFVASIISPTQVLMTSTAGLTTTGALTSYTFDATVAQSGSLLGTGAVTINGTTGTDAPALLADSGVTTANAITVGTTGASRTIGSSSTSGTATYTGNMTLNGGVTLSAAAGGTVAFNTGAIGGTGSVTKSGAGTVTLAGSNGYSGGTTITAGTLVLASNTAAGTTGIAIGASSATLQINSGITIANNITLSNASSAVTRQVAAGGNYTVGTSGNLTSSFGGTNTTAKILAGANSAGTTDTITMSFRNTAAAGNDAIRMSDVFTLSGVTNIGGNQTDLFVLELNASTVALGNFIGWINGSNSWVNAVSGNTGNNATVPQQGYAGAFSSFQTTYGSTLSNYVGAYGVDVGNGNVWAVLNHNSDFGVVPEPTTWALLAFSLTTVMVFRRRRR